MNEKLVQGNFLLTEWMECTFKYKLLNNEEFVLRYWRKGDERVVACVDLQNAVKEPRKTFEGNFESRRKFADSQLARELGFNARAQFTTLIDALKYTNDRYEPFRSTFIERGVKAIVALSDGDLVGILTSLGKSVEEAEEAVVSTATNDKLINKTEQRIKSIKVRNNFTDSIAAANGTQKIYPEATNCCYKTTLGKTAKELRRDLGLKKSGSIRDNLREYELNSVMIYEFTASDGLRLSEADGDGQIRQVLKVTSDNYSSIRETFKNMFK